jgi:CrcB protein
MTDVFLVGIGGSLGAMARYLLSRFVQAQVGPAFPFGTLAVNLIGCLIIGALSQIAEARNVFTPQSRAFVFAGILGGFTTFSSFGNETMVLARADQHLLAVLNVGLHVVLGLGAVWLGRALTGLVIK